MIMMGKAIRQIWVNLFVTNGLKHHYFLGESTYILEAPGATLNFFLQANRTALDEMSHSTESHKFGTLLFAYVPRIGYQATN